MENMKYHNSTIKNIINHLNSCFPGKNDNFSDVVITCSDGQISAHKLVLASISQMLYSEFKQNIWDETLSIILPDFSLLEVRPYLRAIYLCKDISKFTTFNKMIGSIETEEIEIDDKDIKPDTDIKNVNEIDFDSEDIFSFPKDVNGEMINSIESEIEIDNDIKPAIRNVNDIALEDDNRELVEDKATIINIVKGKKCKKGKNLKEGKKSKAEKKSKEVPRLGENKKGYRTERSVLMQYFTMGTDDLKVIYCNICSRQYPEKVLERTTTLLDHLFTHDIKIKWKNKDRSIKCPTCVRVFTSQEKLNEHITRAHSEVMPCAYCGKLISNRVAKRRHENEHKALEERRFTCDICSKAFIDNPALKRHMMIHTGLKPFQCSDCGKQFTVGHKLAEHRRNHTGETPFECSRCFRKFKFKQVLDKHKCIPNIYK